MATTIETLVQVFVNVPDMDRLALMPHPIMLDKHELEAIRVMAHYFTVSIPLARAVEFKIGQVITCLKAWEKDHA